VKKNFYILLLFLLCAIKVAAVSAFPGSVKITQPDGTIVSVVQKGDERVHWMETPDGVTLIRNSNGYITYATKDALGNMVASDVIAQDASERPAKVKSFLSAQPHKVFFSQAQLDSAIIRTKTTTLSQKQNSATTLSGTVKILVVLMSFKDVAFTKTTTDFNNLFNQTGYNVNNNQSSVKEYFAANSYGKFAMTFDIKGPYVAANNRSYYGKNVGGAAGNDQDPDSLVREAIKAIHTSDPSFNFAGYSAISVIFAGNGEEFAGITTDAIWSHQNDFTPPSYCPITHYLCTPEFYANSTSVTCTMGVLCHELNHVLGSPDYYDTNYDNTGDGDYLGTGIWDLMSTGSWNFVGSNYYGTCPPNLTLYQKYRYGWITPTTLTSPATISNMVDNGTKGEAYIVTTPTQGEYYLLENRQKNGYDSSLPGHGLMIYHIAKYADDLYYDLNVTAPQKVYPVCASATGNPSSTVASYGNINSAGCAFPGTSGKTSFTDTTTPSAKTWNGTNCLKPITDITESNGKISFSFMKNQDVAPAPLNLTGTIKASNLVLSWNKPANIPMLSDTIREQHWDGNSIQSALIAGGTQTWSCGQMYSADSLKQYVGKKWTGVKFLPIDANGSNYSIALYKINAVSNSANTMSATLIQSQSVSGVTASAWNEFKFTNPVVIQSGINYGIAVKFTSPSGYTLSVDRGPQMRTGNGYNCGAFYGSSPPFSLLDNTAFDYNFSVRGMIKLDSPISYNVYYNNTLTGKSDTLSYSIPSASLGTYCVKTVNNGIEGTGACINYTASYVVTTNANNATRGTVTGAGNYISGSNCILTAKANQGYIFTNWTENGNVVSILPTDTITVNANHDFIANFAIDSNQFTISATANPSAGGSVTGAGVYTKGASCTVKATANTGYSFVNWTNYGVIVSTNASYTFVTNSDIALTANFTINSYSITATSSSLAGGTVTGAGTYTYGSNCTVTATQAIGYSFTGWSENGVVVSTSPSYTFVVGSARSLTAVFTINHYTITATPFPSTGGTITGLGTYDYGASCILKAVPSNGSTFAYWSENGSVVSRSAQYTISVVDNRDLVANFTSLSPIIYNYDKSSKHIMAPQVVGLDNGAKILIFSPDGRLYRTITNSSYNTSIDLPQGVWIIKAGTKTTKVIVTN
jgi:M6 family metalloprotease-like protein